MTQVDRIALDDEQSRDLAGVWEQVIGYSQIALCIPLADVDALLREYDRTDTLMPILDPTGYRKIMGNVEQHREVARAFRAFRAVLDKYERQARGE